MLTRLPEFPKLTLICDFLFVKQRNNCRPRIIMPGVRTSFRPTKFQRLRYFRPTTSLFLAASCLLFA